LEDYIKDPSGNPPAINAQIQAPWVIIRPRVYRYMKREYVEEFFAKGLLRLSSFKKFSKHEDEQRQDSKEGRALNIGRGESSTIVASTGVGVNSYILCGATNDIDEVRNAFNDCDAAIAIDDTYQFATAVALALSGFIAGREGNCIYKEDRRIERKIEENTVDSLLEKHKLESGGVSMGMITDQMKIVGGVEQFFIKESKYSVQCEYRIIWDCSNTKEYIDIEVPNARQFCRAVEIK